MDPDQTEDDRDVTRELITNRKRTGIVETITTSATEMAEPEEEDVLAGIAPTVEINSGRN